MTHYHTIVKMSEMLPLEIQLNGLVFFKCYNKYISHESQLVQTIIKEPSSTLREESSQLMLFYSTNYWHQF